MKDLNYVIGRLQGLNELVRILKDLVDKKDKGDPEIISTITDHISVQLESILSEFDQVPIDDSKKQALMDIKEKHASDANKAPASEEKLEEIKEVPQEAPEEKLEKHGKTVDDLLKDLESLKSQ